MPDAASKCAHAPDSLASHGLLVLLLQGDDSSLDLQHLQVQRQQAAAVHSALLPPFKSPSPRTLYTLWGWLRRGPAPLPSPQPHSSPSTAARACSAQIRQAEGENHVYSLRAGPQDAAGCIDLGLHGQEQEPWWAVAAALHGVVCALGRQQGQMVQVTRNQRESEFRLLQDSITAYQVLHIQLARS